MRYKYINKAYKAEGAEHGIFCDPVKKDDKCIVSSGKQLVVFENGVKAVVIRRCLRVIDK